MLKTSPTGAIAEWIVEQSCDDLDARAGELVKLSMIDTVGCIFAGLRERSTRLVTETVTCGASLPASVVGRGDRAAPWDAALVAGTAGHALDYDDYDLRSYAHPSVVLVPAVLAVGQQVNASGPELLNAYLTGYHVIQCVGSVVNPESYLTGFHGTSTLGTLGAAAATAKLLSLPHEQVRATIGIAASFLSGLRSNFGTDVKPLHAGRAAQSGVLAAHLASRGFEACPDVIETERGVIDAFAPGGRDALEGRVEHLLDGTISIIEDPPTLKVFPSCGATHAAISGALQLKERLGDGSLERIEKVVVDAPHLFQTILIHHQPSTALEARFSMEGCIALALADGRVGMSQFTEKSVRRPAIQELIRRVQLQGDDHLEARYLSSNSLPSVVTISTGEDSHRVEVLDAPGSRVNPILRNDVLAKFDDCITSSGVRVDRDHILGTLQDLERTDDLSGLLDAISCARLPE